jgi:hypothetical protein
MTLDASTGWLHQWLEATPKLRFFSARVLDPGLEPPHLASTVGILAHLEEVVLDLPITHAAGYLAAVPIPSHTLSLKIFIQRADDHETELAKCAIAIHAYIAQFWSRRTGKTYIATCS